MEFEIQKDELTNKDGSKKEKKVIRMGLVEFIVMVVLLIMLFLLAAVMGVREYYIAGGFGTKNSVAKRKTVDYASENQRFIDELRFDTEDDDINNIINLALNNTLSENMLEMDGVKKQISSGTQDNFAVHVGLKDGNVQEDKDGKTVIYRIYDGDVYDVLDTNKNKVEDGYLDGDNFIKNELSLCNLNMLVMPEVYKIVVENNSTEYVITGISEHYSATEEYVISKATNKLVRAKIKNGALDISREVNF